MQSYYRTNQTLFDLEIKEVPEDELFFNTNNIRLKTKKNSRYGRYYR